MQQIARSATQETWGYLDGCRYVLHDRDTKFCASFRSVLAAGGVRAIPLPARRPFAVTVVAHENRSNPSQAIHFISPGISSGGWVVGALHFNSGTVAFPRPPAKETTECHYSKFAESPVATGENDAHDISKRAPRSFLDPFLPQQPYLDHLGKAHIAEQCQQQDRPVQSRQACKPKRRRQWRIRQPHSQGHYG
jgi:hypothetical protein